MLCFKKNLNNDYLLMIFSCYIGSDEGAGSTNISSLQGAWQTFEDSSYGHHWWNQPEG
jgi:hypothetical protein